MRLNYFSYWLKDVNNNDRYRFDLHNFLNGFCRYENPALKSSFIYSGEHLYLKHHRSNTYILFITRNTDIIRRLNTENLDDQDLRELLQTNEDIAFASYAHIAPDLIAFGSTQMAAKVGALSEFLTQLLERLGVDNYVFRYTPIYTETTFDDAVELPMIGRTELSLAKDNSFAEEIKGFFGNELDENQWEDIDGIDIRIRPKRNRNINGIVGPFLNRIRGSGVQKVHLRAMSREDQDRLSDLYIEAQGPIADTIDPRDRTNLHERIIEKIESNTELMSKLGDQDADEEFKTLPRGTLDEYSDPDVWARRFDDLQNRD